MKTQHQAAAIIIFPPGISPILAERYLNQVLAELPPPLVGCGPLQIGCVDTFNPEYGTPLSTSHEQNRDAEAHASP
jgi:hypothetical protein